MTINEAFELISSIAPCWNCRFKTSSCNRDTAHVWKDGLCHDFDEALSVLSELIETNESGNDGND